MGQHCQRLRAGFPNRLVRYGDEKVVVEGHMVEVLGEFLGQVSVEHVRMDRDVARRWCRHRSDSIDVNHIGADDTLADVDSPRQPALIVGQAFEQRPGQSIGEADQRLSPAQWQVPVGTTTPACQVVSQAD